jgi:hypothetical protein
MFVSIAMDSQITGYIKDLPNLSVSDRVCMLHPVKKDGSYVQLNLKASALVLLHRLCHYSILSPSRI